MCRLRVTRISGTSHRSGEAGFIIDAESRRLWLARSSVMRDLPDRGDLWVQKPAENATVTLDRKGRPDGPCPIVVSALQDNPNRECGLFTGVPNSMRDLRVETDGLIGA